MSFEEYLSGNSNNSNNLNESTKAFTAKGFTIRVTTENYKNEKMAKISTSENGNFSSKRTYLDLNYVFHLEILENRKVVYSDEINIDPRDLEFKNRGGYWQVEAGYVDQLNVSNFNKNLDKLYDNDEYPFSEFENHSSKTVNISAGLKNIDFTVVETDKGLITQVLDNGGGSSGIEVKVDRQKIGELFCNNIAKSIADTIEDSYVVIEEYTGAFFYNLAHQKASLQRKHLAAIEENLDTYILLEVPCLIHFEYSGGPDDAEVIRKMQSALKNDSYFVKQDSL